MKLLIDTHCWLWLTAAPERFSPEALKQIKAADTELFLSAASAWEIAVKYALGKLRLPDLPGKYLARYLHETRTTPLSITLEHATHVAELPQHHRDPFDRLLIAQARLERLALLTADSQIGEYDVEVIDAE